jgi:uncharacterized protein
MMAVRVLSIDGGGIRSLIPARVLVELERLTGSPTAKLFDLIAGTGAGATLALALTAPGAAGRPRFSARQILDLYLERGHELFPAPDPLPRLRRLAHLQGAHPATGLLHELFGETALGDAVVDVLVPTFDPAAAAPLIFRSDEFNPDQGPPMREVALASASVPTHFASVPIELSARSLRLTHGGIVANNPAGFAYATALSRAEPSQVLLVSLGSGGRSCTRGAGSATGANDYWPLSAGPAFELQLEAASEAQHQIIDALLAASGHRDRYWRVQPPPQADPQDHTLNDPATADRVAEGCVSARRAELSAIAEAVA